jgi:hypothetical protein
MTHEKFEKINPDKANNQEELWQDGNILFWIIHNGRVVTNTVKNNENIL